MWIESVAVIDLKCHDSLLGTLHSGELDKPGMLPSFFPICVVSEARWIGEQAAVIKKQWMYLMSSGCVPNSQYIGDTDMTVYM